MFTIIQEDDWQGICQQWEMDPTKGIRAVVEVGTTYTDTIRKNAGEGEEFIHHQDDTILLDPSNGKKTHANEIPDTNLSELGTPPDHSKVENVYLRTTPEVSCCLKLWLRWGCIVEGSYLQGKVSGLSGDVYIADDTVTVIEVLRQWHPFQTKICTLCTNTTAGLRTRHIEPCVLVPFQVVLIRIYLQRDLRYSSTLLSIYIKYLFCDVQVCRVCIEERETHEYLTKLNYTNREISVDLVRGKEPPPSLLVASSGYEAERRTSKRARRASASSGGRILLKVSGDTTVFQLKLQVWESLAV